MEFILADKPSGVTTHSSLDDRQSARKLTDIEDGFVEHLSSRLGFPLHVAHRLDRDTTGAMVFAKTPAMAEILRRAFESRSVSKQYLFVTDKTIARDEFTAESFIDRQRNEYISDATKPANARTTFKKIEESHGLTLWEAKPETGKSHQIRLHAQDHGISILGDREHGGAVFPTLCLHSASLAIAFEGLTFKHESPAPRYFHRREWVRESLLARWWIGVDRRERLLRSLPPGAATATPESREQTLRWLHHEGDPLRMEALGDVLSLSWFKDREPQDQEWNAIRTLIDTLGFKRWYLQVRGNRGRAPANETIVMSPDPVPPRWTAQERDLKFEFRTDSGLSPGLFLDQRRNREWISRATKDARVLNLFCYTGGFSVAAAKGGAKQVVSVDVSKVFLEWAKVNFGLNDLTIEGHEFRAMDSREYLAWAKKKGISFDLVICDPPSFSRSKSGLFKIEDDFADLVKALLDVTAPGGRCLFALNYEGWDEEALEKRALEAVKASGVKTARLERTPSPDWDFELPRQPHNMKSFFILRD